MSQFYDNIEAYLCGELEESERKLFEDALQSDPILQEQVALHRVLIARLRGAQLRQRVKKNLSPLPKKIPFWKYLLTAMGVASLAGVVFFLTPSDEQNPKESTPAPTEPSPKTQTNPATPIAETESPVLVPPPNRLKPKTITDDPIVLAACASAIEALDDFDRTTMSGDDDGKDLAIEQQLNVVASLLRDRNPAATEPLLRAVRKKNNPLYQADAEWLGLLGLLLLDPEQGTKRLTKIAEKPSHPYRRSAINLLGNLE